MGTRQTDFRQKVAEARKYEVALSEWLQRRLGFHVLPTYDYSGLGEDKSPRLYHLDEHLVIPDLLAFRDGRGVWVECKWKTSATLHRITNTRCTGMSRRHFEHYRRVKAVSGHDVRIVFIHVAEGELRGDEIDALAATVHHEYEGDKMGWSGMVFWDYDGLPLVGTLGELRIAA